MISVITGRNSVVCVSSTLDSLSYQLVVTIYIVTLQSERVGSTVERSVSDVIE